MSSDDRDLGHSLVPGGAPQGGQLSVATSVLRMLAEPTRLHLPWTLAHADADVTSLSQNTDASRTSVNQHLAKLRLAGLVVSRRESRHIVYSMPDGHLRRLVLEALNFADHQVTGEPPHS